MIQKATFCFQKKEDYKSNFNTDYSFNIRENFVIISSKTTADYDRWEHNTNFSCSYYHLDGTPFNIPNNIKLNFCHNSNNICVFGTKKEVYSTGKYYYYSIDKKQIVFSFDKVYDKINSMLEEINNIYNKKITKLVVEKAVKYYKSLLKKYPCEKEDLIKLNEEIKNALKNYTAGSYWFGIDCENNLNTNREEIIHKFNLFMSRNSLRALCANSSFNIRELNNFENNDYCNQLIISFFKEEGLNDFDNEYKKVKYDYNRNIDYYDKYKNLTLFKIDDKLNININKNNITKFNKHYENVTGKKSTLIINDFLPNFVKNDKKEKIINSNYEYDEKTM